MSKTRAKEVHESRVLTALSVCAPGASEVFVAGTFNDWCPTSHPMEQETPGNWVLALDLAPGFYQYKFIIDGEWCCDPECDEPCGDCSKCVPNEFGTMNHVLIVSELQPVEA